MLFSTCSYQQHQNTVLTQPLLQAVGAEATPRSEAGILQQPPVKDWVLLLLVRRDTQRSIWEIKDPFSNIFSTSEVTDRVSLHLEDSYTSKSHSCPCPTTLLRAEEIHWFPVQPNAAPSPLSTSHQAVSGTLRMTDFSLEI